jgi:hypothetical protein
MGITRRAFVGLAGTAAASVALTPHLVLAAATHPLKPSGYFHPPALLSVGTFGKDEMVRRFRNLAQMYGVPADIDLAYGHYWTDFGRILRALPNTAEPGLGHLFRDFTHGEDLARFVLTLSRVDLASDAGPAPHPAELGLLSTSLFGSNSSSFDVAPATAGWEDIRAYELTLDWDQALAMPKVGPEFDTNMVVAAAGVALAAIEPAANHMQSLIEKDTNAIGMSPLGYCLGQVVLGGLQSIAYQNALRRDPASAILLANLLARSYLFLGQRGDGRLVFMIVKRSMEP